MKILKRGFKKNMKKNEILKKITKKNNELIKTIFFVKIQNFCKLIKFRLYTSYTFTNEKLRKKDVKKI